MPYVKTTATHRRPSLPIAMSEACRQSVPRDEMEKYIIQA